MPRKVYRVRPDRQVGGWKIETGSRTLSQHGTKEEALKRGRELARAQSLGQLVVHGASGQIQAEYTYGKDPRATKG